MGRDGTDDPAVFAVYLRTLKWNTATASDRDLLQAPFRAGIRLDPYQLLPLRKALRLPRVNLLIADDVGLGKTIEAGLILRELLLRRRIDFTVVAAPPSMTSQWQDELEAKFGLAFTIIDRERVAELRRLRGFGINPWFTGSRFIISHHLLTDETYVAGLRDLLGEFRSRALLILDEAHHAAPASGAPSGSLAFAAFLRTVEVHRKSLLALIEKQEAAAPIDAAKSFVTGSFDQDELPVDVEEQTAEETIVTDEDAAAEAASRLGDVGA